MYVHFDYQNTDLNAFPNVPVVISLVSIPNCWESIEIKIFPYKY